MTLKWIYKLFKFIVFKWAHTLTESFIIIKNNRLSLFYWSGRLYTTNLVNHKSYKNIVNKW